MLNQSIEVRCVFSSLEQETSAFDRSSQESVETLTNSPSPNAVQTSMYDHSPVPTFEDWSKQAEELITILSKNDSQESASNVKDRLAVPKGHKRSASASTATKSQKKKAARKGRWL